MEDREEKRSGAGGMMKWINWYGRIERFTGHGTRIDDVSVKVTHITKGGGVEGAVPTQGRQTVEITLTFATHVKPTLHQKTLRQEESRS